MALLHAVLLVLAAVLVAGTLLPLLRVPWWWVRLFDFPRLQMLALMGLVGAGLAATGGPAWVVGALAAAAAWQLWRIYPYTRLARVQALPATAPPAGRTLRLVFSNVLMTNRDAARWARVVTAEDADVVAALETDAWWARTIADALGRTHPHAVELPQDDTYGIVVRSRLPVVAHEVRHLVEPEVPSVWLRLRLPAGDEVALGVVHPRPPRPDVQQDSTLRDAELVRAAACVDADAGPVVVGGDLNDVAWSDTTTLFQKLSGLLDPRVGRGLFPTFHARHAWLRYPLDHVFHSDHFAVVDLARLPDVGSDHFPFRITLALDPRREAEHETPEADADDRAEAAGKDAEAEQVLAEETPDEKAKRMADDV